MVYLALQVYYVFLNVVGDSLSPVLPLYDALHIGVKGISEQLAHWEIKEVIRL